MVEGVKARAQGGIVLALLVLSLVTPFLLGGFGAYLQIFCAVLCLVTLLIGRRPLAVSGDPAYPMLLAAFAILAVAFGVTASTPADALHVFDFGMLLGLGPLSQFLSRFAAPGNSRRVVDLALVGSILAFAVSLFEIVVSKQVRAEGWETDPIWSAEAAIILGFMASLGYLMGGSWRPLYLLGPVAGVTTSVLAGSRGPLLAVPVLLLIVLLAGTRRRWLLLAWVLAASLALWLVFRFLLPAQLDRIMSIFTVAQDVAGGADIGEVSASTRRAFYEASLAAFLNSPLIGYGWVGKMEAIVPFLPGNGAALVLPHRHLHSDLLDFGVAGGLSGLIAYGLIIAAPIVGAVRAPRDSQYRIRRGGAVLLAAGYLICGLTYLMFGYEFHTSLFVCLLAILIGYCRDAPPAVSRDGPAPAPA